jgi:type IV pilus assembly protein PilX
MATIDARLGPNRPPRPIVTCAPARQNGVVLVVSLVMLLVVSVIASVSMRNAASTESASGAVRTTELAMQAAEVALRHCEAAVIQVVGGGPPTMTTTFTLNDILPAGDATHWQDPKHWDNKTTATFVVSLDLLNASGLRTTYQRPPECMVEPLKVLFKDEVTPKTDAGFVITVRGFGPEVPAGAGRPKGTEVWLQSHLQLE